MDRSGEPANAGESPEVLETGRLVVELFHVVLAFGRSQGEQAGHGRSDACPAIGNGSRSGGRRMPLSGHAVRAALQIDRLGSCTISELAAGLGVSLGWASRMAEELEERGYLVRERDAADRRVVHVRLTPRAVGVVESTYQWPADAVAQALHGLDPAERAAVRTFLSKLVGHFSESIASDGSAQEEAAGGAG